MKISSFLLIILILGIGMISSCTSPSERRAKLSAVSAIEDPTDTFYIVNTMTSERIRIIVKNDKGTRIDYPSTYMLIEQ